jgi:hypothetical protein
VLSEDERRSHDYIRHGTTGLFAALNTATGKVTGRLSAHKAPVMQKWLIAHPRVRLHFTPAYSCWISRAERWFAELQRRGGGG